jgi:hypothetical protein
MARLAKRWILIFCQIEGAMKMAGGPRSRRRHLQAHLHLGEA